MEVIDSANKYSEESEEHGREKSMSPESISESQTIGGNIQLKNTAN